MMIADGAYIASTLPHRGQCGVTACIQETRGKVFVVTARGWVDWPIMYDDGRIAYDFPERVPARLRNQVTRALTLAKGAQ